MGRAMSDNHSIEALNERMDNMEDLVSEISEDIFTELTDLSERMRELEINLTSVIGMFTQMNISLLQIQSDILGKDDK
jgi:predicted  nucleic acid-binding Zn-ribbon protein